MWLKPYLTPIIYYFRIDRQARVYRDLNDDKGFVSECFRLFILSIDFKSIVIDLIFSCGHQHSMTMILLDNPALRKLNDMP